MGQLFLLRHAKAKWAEPGMKDFDRELDERGHTEAAAMGKAMKVNGLRPDLVICSNAVRAKQTFEHIDAALDLKADTRFTDNLYASDAPGYLDIAAQADDVGSVMLIGHNPMMEDLAIGLSETGDKEAISELQMGFRTAGLAIIDFEGAPSSFASSTGSLTMYLTPDDL